MQALEYHMLVQKEYCYKETFYYVKVEVNPFVVKLNIELSIVDTEV